MSNLVPESQIEAIVGVKRQQSNHIARAVSAEQTVYILHPYHCAARLTFRPLTECRYSLALDKGIDLDVWADWQDRPVVVIGDATGRLRPVREVMEDE